MTISRCQSILSSISQDDSDRVLAKLETYQKAGMSPREASIMAVGDALSEHGREVQEMAGFIRSSMTSRAKASQDLAAKANEAATSLENDRPQPTAAQAEAGNYKKGRVKLHGLDISIENPAGSVRVAKDGSWASAMPSHYGYIRRSEGNDGDHVDAFIGPNPEGTKVFVIDQVNPKTGEFDEHKVMLGFGSKEAAEAGYKAAYPADWKGMGAITETGTERLKTWLRAGKATDPFGAVKKPEVVNSRYNLNIDDSAGTDATYDADADADIARITGKPSLEVTDIRGGKQLDATQRGFVAAAIKDLLALGLPRTVLEKISAVHAQGGQTGDGTYYWQPRAIGIHTRIFDAIAAGDKAAMKTLRGLLAHELVHSMDDGAQHYYSSVAPSLEIVGAGRQRVPIGGIAAEAFEAWRKSGPVSKFLDYPFAMLHDSAPQGMTNDDWNGVLQAEVLAQLGRLYLTNPKLLQRTMPKSFFMFEEIFRDIRNNHDRPGIAVQRALRGLGADGLPAKRVARGDRSPDRGRIGDRNAREGVEGSAGGIDRGEAAGQAGVAGRPGDAGLEAAPRAAVGADQAQRLTGAPDGYEPSAVAQQTARDYMKKAGLPYNPPTAYVKVDKARAERIAAAYDEMAHTPSDPRVRMAYGAMIRETLAQWEAIKVTGLKVTFATDGKPYPYTVPSEVFKDVAENNHMWVFPTMDGFGSDASVDVSDNPLLAPTGETIDGHKLVANDVFRIVHDYFGHIKNGVGFRANGEENAWRAHSAMYSPMARAAMTSETRGQNSWVNWGPNGEANRTANQIDTVYADQKTGLLPAEFIEDNYAKPALDPNGVATVNIGLETNDGKGITAIEAARALRAAGVKIKASEVRKSKTEQTLIATLDRPLTPEEASKVSVALHQDAIAQRVGDAGELYGPKAEEWGPFNEKFFLGHSKTGENALMTREASDALRSAAGTALTKQELAVLKSGVPRVAMKRAQRFAALFKQLPSTSDYVHAALAGRAARGWYEKSRRAGEAMYGKDYPRFAALMAALSPQTDVPTNFYNAAQVWADWHRSGRPTSVSDITAILNRNVVTPDGRKGGAEVMDAYKFNTIRALAHKTGDVQLSGPKVESFRNNLIGNLNEVTNDRHVAAFSGIMQELLSGTQIASTDGVGKSFGLKSPGYIAPSVRYRQAARELSKLTGETWAPAEVQETGWSFWRTLYNLATAQGETRSALQLIRDGALTHELIAETPTLGQYFDTKRYGHITRGEKQAPDGDADAASRISAAERGATRETGPVVETPAVKRIAKRLDRLIENRARLEKLNAEIKAQDETLDVQGPDRAAEIEALEAEIGRIAADDDSDPPGFDAPRKPDALDAREPEPLWYSALDTAITDKAPWAKDGSIPVNQLRGWLGSKSKDGTFKPDELKWSGLEEFLATKDGRVTRDEVREFLAGNGVKVEEVTLGEAQPPEGWVMWPPNNAAGTERWKFSNGTIRGYGDTRQDAIIDAKMALEREARRWQKNGDEERAQRIFARADEFDAYMESIAGKSPNGEEVTKFSSYVLPGGENYRELLLTLPEKKLSFADWAKAADVEGDANTPSMRKYVEQAYQDYLDGEADRQLSKAFKSQHYDQPNILAHIRFNERTDADGKRVLFIEEIQSDWAQKGRKEGFSDDKPLPTSLPAGYRVERGADVPHLHRTGAPYIVMGPRMGGGAGEGSYASGNTPEEATRRALEALRDDFGTRSPIPAAPFVGKTEAWVALAMKRMIRYAADNNFDRVAWTTGEQQAARYDLSKQVSEVQYDPERKLLKVRDLADNKVLEKTVEPDGIEEYVGKDVAKNLLASPLNGRYHSVKGDGLKIGGEGMTAFYDRIIPNVANDLLKKLGGGRVGTVSIAAAESNTAAVRYAAVERGGSWRVVDMESDGGQYVGGLYADGASAAGAAEKLNGSADAQPGFAITPDMAPRARKPQALFAMEPTAPRKPDSLDFNLRTAATNAVHDSITTSRAFNLWDRTVGTPLHKASKSPLFKRVYDGVQNFLNDSSQLMMQAADLAPDLLPKLDGIKDMFKRGLSRADLKKVSAAVFEGRLNDTVYTDAELSQRGLDRSQIGYYRQARAAIDKSLTDTVVSEAVKQAKGLLPQSVLDQAKNDGNPWVVVDALANIQPKTPVQQQVYDQLRLAVANIEELKANGYAPLQRFGQYTVEATVSGEHTFTMHESEREANAFARTLREMGSTDVERGVMSQEAWKLFQGTSPDTLEIFADALGASNSEVMQKFIKLAVNNKSVMKRMLRAKKTAGFQTDVQRTLAQFITSNARAASKNYHWGEVLKATNEIPKERGDIKDEAVRLKDYIENPMEEAGALRGLLFIQFLGGSVASAATNATQPIMMTFPWLAQYGGAVNAAAQLAGAGKVAMGGAAEPGLAEALLRGEKEGIVSPHEVAGLYAESMRNFGSNMAVRRALKLWGSLFSLAEQFNRRITFVAAYRTAVKEGMPDPYGFAVNAIAETQGVYNKGNRPNFSRGAVGATLMTFKQYSVAYMEFLARLPKKQRAIALAALVLAAGLQGLPGADDLEDVIDTIAESLGYSFNSKKQLREWATRTLGESAGAFLVSGASAIPGVPLDVQGRLGIGNLFPGTGILKRSNEDKSREVLDFFGPAGSQVKSFMDAFSAAQEGDAAAMVKAGLPVAIKNALQGLSMAQSGFYKDTQGRRVIDTDGYDAAIKSVGFQPAAVARQTRIVQDAMQDIGLAKNVEATLADKMARAIVDHDPEALQKARVELFEWNQTNPGSRIAITPSQVQQRVRQYMMTREQRFAKTAPKEMRAGVMAELRQ